MQDMSAWSVNLGRWSGVQIRLHASLLFVIIGVMYLAGRDQHTAEGLMLVGVMLVSLLVHEFGHAIAAVRCGGNCDCMVLGPLGGLTHPQVPHDPPVDLKVSLAGPFVSGLACLASGALLLTAFDRVEFVPLLNPVGFPSGILDAPMIVMSLQMVFWVNWVLLVFNLLPAFPADGARALRSVFWPAVGYRSAAQMAARVSFVTAAMLVLLAWFASDVFPASSVAPSLPLVVLALMIVFCARSQLVKLDEPEPGDELFGYDFSQGYTSLERTFETHRPPSVGFLRRWLNQRRETKIRRRRAQEQEEERRVDGILARLHQTGFDRLSDDERQLLDRVSQRYRNRQGN
jgi:Zn-dependent protease